MKDDHRKREVGLGNRRGNAGAFRNGREGYTVGLSNRYPLSSEV